MASKQVFYFKVAFVIHYKSQDPPPSIGVYMVEYEIVYYLACMNADSVSIVFGASGAGCGLS